MNTNTLGDQLVADALAGDLSLLLDDVADFDEEGGSLAISDLGVVLTYSAADDETGVITLVDPVPADVFEGDRVLVMSTDPVGAVAEVVAQVAVEGTEQADDTIEAIVSHALIPLLAEGIRGDSGIGTVGEAVVLEQRGDDYFVVDVLARPALFDAAALDPTTTIPPRALTDGLAPGASPTPVLVAGIGVIFVGFDEVENADPVTVDVHVSKTPFVGVTADSTTLVGSATGVGPVPVRALPSGEPLVSGTPYYFVTVARDADGPAPQSVQVSGTPALVTGPDIAVNEVKTEHLVAGSITADKFAASIALVTKLFVGSRISIIPSGEHNGIRVETDNGGMIYLPADGSGAQFLRVALEATSLLIEDSFELRGASNRIAGSLKLALGAVAPTAGPSVSSTWSAPGVKVNLGPAAIGGSAGGRFGLYDGGSTWMTIEWDAAMTGFVVGYDKTTNARTVLLEVTGQDIIGVTNSGGDWYVLCLEVSSGQYRVRKYNGSWVYSGTSFVPGPLTNSIPRTISSDGSTLYLGYWRNSGDSKVVIRSMTTGGASQTTICTTIDEFPSLTSLLVTTAGFGVDVQRFVILPGSENVRVYSALGSRVTSEEWSRPNAEGQSGILWDGTNFRVLTDLFNIWKLSSVVTATTRSVRYSQYDSNPTGGTHESAWSPATPYTQPPRQWFKVTTPPPADNGGPDDPDTTRVYIQNAGAGPYYRQADLAESPWSGYYGSPSVTGAVAVTTPDFAGVQNPGIVESSVSDASGPLVQFKGDGTWRLSTLTGMVVPYLGATAPAGFVLADGASYAVASYPELFAVTGYTYGGSGANFNVPDLKDRTVMGTSATKPRGSASGADSATVAGHVHSVGAHTHPLSTSSNATLGGSSIRNNATNTQASDAFNTSTAGGHTVPTIPKNVSMNYIIKT